MLKYKSFKVKADMVEKEANYSKTISNPLCKHHLLLSIKPSKSPCLCMNIKRKLNTNSCLLHAPQPQTFTCILFLSLQLFIVQRFLLSSCHLHMMCLSTVCLAGQILTDLHNSADRNKGI